MIYETNQLQPLRAPPHPPPLVVNALQALYTEQLREATPTQQRDAKANKIAYCKKNKNHFWIGRSLKKYTDKYKLQAHLQNRPSISTLLIICIKDLN